MPIFNFRCYAEDCANHFEYLGKEEELTSLRCPKCGKDEIERQVSTFGSYTIKGNNSASVTPKKFRAGK